MPLLQPGATPSFMLNSTPDQRLSLAELRGERVILAFDPADWSPLGVNPGADGILEALEAMPKKGSR